MMKIFWNKISKVDSTVLLWINKDKDKSFGAELKKLLLFCIRLFIVML
jgi:hypothetical protein